MTPNFSAERMAGLVRSWRFGSRYRASHRSPRRSPTSTRMPSYRLFQCLALALLMCSAGCGHSARMSQDDVVKAANSAAVNAGYALAKYGVPKAHYEFVRKDKTWTVFYTMKPPTPPGGHFQVWVEDQTGKTQVMRGE